MVSFRYVFQKRIRFFLEKRYKRVLYLPTTFLKPHQFLEEEILYLTSDDPIVKTYSFPWNTLSRPTQVLKKNKKEVHLRLSHLYHALNTIPDYDIEEKPFEPIKKKSFFQYDFPLNYILLLVTLILLWRGSYGLVGICCLILAHVL